MAHKHTRAQIDAVINQWRGKHAVEKMIAEYDGSKWSKYQRYRMEGEFIFHIATDTLKLMITPADAELEARRCKSGSKGGQVEVRHRGNVQSVQSERAETQGRHEGSGSEDVGTQRSR